MIANNFVYILPDTKEQAVAHFQNDPSAMYYGGGSEIISLCRTGAIAPGRVIDLKAIPEASILERPADTLVIGGCVSLRAIQDSGMFPLLGKICGRIADHTNQCRITLAGNMMGTIQYRETCQALLLADADIVLFGPKGLRIESIHALFDGRVCLAPGEFVLQVRIAGQYLSARFNHIKKTSGEKIDYPLISVSALEAPEGIRFSVSGLLDHPFRSAAMEKAFNDRGASKDKRMNDMLASLPASPLADYQGSAEYRLFVFKQTMLTLMEEMAA